MARLSKEKQKQYKQEYKRERRRINDYIRRKEQQGFAVEYNKIVKTPKYVTKKDVDRLRNITKKKLLNKTYYYDTIDPETGEVALVKGQVAIEAKRREAKRLKELEKNTDEHQEKDYSPDRDEAYEHEDVSKEFENIDRTSNETFEEQSPYYLSYDVVNDSELIAQSVKDLIQTFDARKFYSEREALVVQDGNDNLNKMLNNAIKEFGEDVVNRRIAENYSELVQIVNNVQGYVNVAGEFTTFYELLFSRSLTLEENMQYTESYNDSDALADYDIEDFYS